MTQLSIDQPAETQGAFRASPWIYFALAYAVSWFFWFVALGLRLSIRTPAGRMLELAGNFGPLFAALILLYFTKGKGGLRALLKRLIAWQVNAGTYLVAILLPFVLIGAALAVNLAVGGLIIENRNPGFLLGFTSLFLRSLFISGGLNEETGWRGVALPGLLGRYSPVRASLIVGLLWGAWHLPLYFLPGTDQNAMATNAVTFLILFSAFIIWTIGLSILFTWLHTLASGSLWIMMLFHAAINTASGLPLLMGMQAPMVSLLYPVFTWVAALVAIERLKRSS